ncbi:hypothetical protein ACFLIN_03825 [Corynebacterium kutscheri]|uniref:hypothetical protein n=1 Tax=Corynebacterium kutscheri TaxID=35755 RepID=UPI0037BEBDCB
MPKGFPTCSSKKLLKIIQKYADKTGGTTKGSHQKYKSRISGKVFVFATRKKDFQTHLVRKILVQDLGLTEEQALEEVQ